MIVDLLIDTI